jgi:hypothetical protein
MEKREILYCNLTVLKNNKKTIINEVVFKNVDGYYKGNKVLDIDVICSLGFENLTNEFTEVKKSDEKRNNITGAYE